MLKKKFAVRRQSVHFPPTLRVSYDRDAAWQEQEERGAGEEVGYFGHQEFEEE